VPLVPARTSTIRIGVGRRVGQKNSRDCDDRILERWNDDNRAAAAAQTFRFLWQVEVDRIKDRRKAVLRAQIVVRWRRMAFTEPRVNVFVSDEGSSVEFLGRNGLLYGREWRR
jgi:hypothetical protein